jgi:hypothetical protein
MALVLKWDDDPATDLADMQRLCELQDVMLIELAGTSATTQEGMRAKARLALDALRCEVVDVLDGVTLLTLIEPLLWEIAEGECREPGSRFGLPPARERVTG